MTRHRKRRKTNSKHTTENLAHLKKSVNSTITLSDTNSEEKKRKEQEANEKNKYTNSQTTALSHTASYSQNIMLQTDDTATMLDEVQSPENGPGSDPKDLAPTPAPKTTTENPQSSKNKTAPPPPSKTSHHSPKNTDDTGEYQKSKTTPEGKKIPNTILKK